MDLTGGKYLRKIIFDIKIEIGIFQIPNVPNFNKFWSLGTNLGWKINIFFNIKIEIRIFEIWHVPIFNKFWAFFDYGVILGLTGGRYFTKINFDFIWEINNWLYADELLYLDKLFQNHSLRILFPMILITRKFFLTFSFRVSNSEILFLFII